MLKAFNVHIDNYLYNHSFLAIIYFIEFLLYQTHGYYVFKKLDKGIPLYML